MTSSPRPRVASRPGLSGPPAGPSAPMGAAPPAARRPWPAVLVALALAATGGAFWYARAGSARPPAGTSPVVLVAERGQVAVESGAVAPAVAAAPPAAAAPQAITASRAASDRGSPGSPLDGRPPAPTPARRAGRAAAAAGTARGGSFSTTFARRESDIRRCFLDHPGARSTALWLRFDVERDGHVGSVAVQPASVAGGPLGACLAAVGKSTVFPKQAAPVTFRIPLTVETVGTNAR